MRVWFVLMLGVSLLGLSGSARAAACEEGILPDATAAGGRDSCEYTHVPHASFSHQDGKVKATWGKEFQVLEMYVLEDWSVLAAYLPGRELPLQRDSSKAYDFVGRLRNVRTQEEVLSITPMWCRHGSTLAPIRGCRGYSPSSCSTTDGTTCPDGTHVSVTCEGDSGTCDSCGTEGQSACCKSRLTTTQTTTDGTTNTSTVNFERRQNCPPSAPEEPTPTP